MARGECRSPECTWWLVAGNNLSHAADCTDAQVLDKLQEAFGRRTLFEFQDNKGKLVRVDDEHKWMHFCANADNVVPSGMQPTLDVFVSEWR